jgi:16S rRNA (guanine527-N7)-methyltransferase
MQEKSPQLSFLIDEIIYASQKENISLSVNELELVKAHATLLLTWNRKMNLTRIRDPREIASRHFVEGLCAGDLLRSEGLEGPLLDLGSGNGFPGVPMAIACSRALPITLVESSERKGAFLRVLLRELGWDSSQVLVRRIDKGSDLADIPCHIFTSRGVALSHLMEEGPTFLESGSFAILFAAKPPGGGSPFRGFAVQGFRTIHGRETGIFLLRRI